MSYLVTGSAGFIGSHLCEKLLSMKKRVYAIDNLSTGSYQNISSLRSHQNFSFFVGDISDIELMEDLVKKSKTIYHLAAAVGVRHIIDNPVETLESNVFGSQVVFSLAAKYNRKTILTSTSEVYGKSEKKIFSEDIDLVMGASTKKRWGYACSKLLDEFLALAYHEKKGLPVIIVRLFNTVGPRQTGRYGMVVPTFVKQALAGEPITVFGSGMQSRCFCHVDEIVNALISLVNEDKAIGEIINLGNTYPISIFELAQKIKEITGSTSEIVTVPYNYAYSRGFEDMEHRIPDISKARKLVGFNPQKSISDIIHDVVGYYEQQNMLSQEKKIKQAPHYNQIRKVI
jgi:UDP-glucose 4-epimerase